MQRNTKEWIQYGSAIFLLTSGVAMAFLSFFFNLLFLHIFFKTCIEGYLVFKYS